MNKGTIVGVMIEPMKGEKVRQEEINSKLAAIIKGKEPFPPVSCVATLKFNASTSLSGGCKVAEHEECARM